VVIPSLPGFGFSTPVTTPGWEAGRAGRAFAELMRRLGYDRYGAQGGDIGAGVAKSLASGDPEHVRAIHINADPLVLAFMGDVTDGAAALSQDEQRVLARVSQVRAEGRGYVEIQSTRPQTPAYSLVDSPVGQLAWIVEKFEEWTNPSATLPEDAVDKDLLLANVCLYWFKGTGASAAHFYYEAAHNPMDWTATSATPQGWAVFGGGGDLVRRVFDPADRIEHWCEYEAGGHFAALEEPELFVGDVRNFFRRFR
jgi:pimeloyl-ACP methyl ester carboxylesterase